MTKDGNSVIVKQLWDHQRLWAVAIDLPILFLDHPLFLDVTFEHLLECPIRPSFLSLKQLSQLRVYYNCDSTSIRLRRKINMFIFCGVERRRSQSWRQRRSSSYEHRKKEWFFHSCLSILVHSKFSCCEVSKSDSQSFCWRHWLTIMRVPNDIDIDLLTVQRHLCPFLGNV